MRIDQKNNIDQVLHSTIRQKGSVTKGKDQAETLVNQNTKDRVELSKKAADYDPVSAAKDKVISELEKGSDANRLRQLKADIENGVYHISAKDIAGAMLGVLKKGE